jgi:hypothetical protein
MNLAANEGLADTSNLLVYSAMAVYALAFLAHIAEWILGSRSKVARTSSALAEAEETQEAANETATVAVTVRKGGTTAVLERPAAPAPPKVVTRSSVPGRDDIPDGPGAAGDDEQGDAYGRIAVSLSVLAFALHAGAVLARAVAVGRAPWANMYEFSTSFSMVVVGAYLGLLLVKKNVRWLGLPLVTTVLLDLGLAVTVLYNDSTQLVPALDSYWLWIHVSLAITCGALFYLGMVATVLFLLRDRYESRMLAGRESGAFATSVLRRLPRVDLHDHRGRDLGGERLGPLLGLGPEGGLVLHHVGGLRLLPARPLDGGLARPQGRIPGDRGVPVLPLQLLRREHVRGRQALLLGDLRGFPPAQPCAGWMTTARSEVVPRITPHYLRDG